MDDELRCQVAVELSWDPQVDSEAIEVSANSGTVTLRGTVASLQQKRAGNKAAARVRGVIRVANECGYGSRTETSGTMTTCAGTCWKR
jgi:osmotically-inducible protein OsmY